jgi:hypothetical protein
VLPRPLTKNVFDVPIWVWLVGLLPWIWTVPMNQLFWDDWAISASAGLDAQLQFWRYQAKHPMNPYVYSALLPLGPWAFHLLVIAASVVMARSLQVILFATRLVEPKVAAWAGPIALSLPVVHARVSIATFEYSIAIAALLCAWALLLRHEGTLRELWAALLLIFSVGVPSLAIVFPIIWMTTILQRSSYRLSRRSLTAALRFLYVPLIPVLYSAVFQFVLNTKNKFRMSRDGLIDFNNDFLRLILVATVVLLIVRRFGPTWFSFSWRLAVGVFAAYVALFPYFAVGYKPLFDFMPWKMRSDVKEVAIPRLAYVGLSLLVIATLVFFVTTRGLQRRLSGLTIPVILAAVFFGSATAVLGPMDWESRHWLIAWPALAALFTIALAGLRDHVRRPAAIATLVVFALSTSLISSEYVVDSMKQRAIIQAVRQEAEQLQVRSTADGGYTVLVYFVNSPNKLNARFRKLRPYEWWGLIAKGLNVDPQKLKMLEPEDFDLLVRHLTCASPVSVLQVEPEITSSRMSALSRLKVDVELHGRLIQLCNTRVRFGWPRDPLVRPS